MKRLRKNRDRGLTSIVLSKILVPHLKELDAISNKVEASNRQSHYQNDLLADFYLLPKIIKQEPLLKSHIATTLDHQS